MALEGHQNSFPGIPISIPAPLMLNIALTATLALGGKMKNSKPDGHSINAAGVYFVIAELERRGLSVFTPAPLSQRIVVMGPNRRPLANLKVIAGNGNIRSWSNLTPVRATPSRKNWYAFVCCVEDSRFEVFLERAERVSTEISQNPGRAWRIRSLKQEQRVRRQWSELGRSQNARLVTTDAGVYFVAAELSRRGLLVLPATRNARAIDLMVTNEDRTWHASLKVRMKNNRASSWSMASRFRGTVSRKDWYAFVRYLEDESRFEVFLESAERVHKQIFHLRWRLPFNDAERERVRHQWREFGLSQKTS